MTTQEDWESGWKTVDFGKIENNDDYQDDDDQDEHDDEAEEDDGAEEQKAREKDTARKSRAKDRIQQLVKEREAEKAARLKAEQELMALKQSSTLTKKENLGAQIKLMDSQISSLQRELKSAKEDADTDRELEILDKLDNLRLDKRIAEAQESKLSVEDAKPTNTQETKDEQAQIEIPQEMKYWLEENEWAVRPSNRQERKKVQFIRSLSRELIKEGYSEFEPDFYDEVDARLAEWEKEQKKQFGSKDESMLQYENKDSSSNDRTLNRSRQQNKSPVSGPSGSAPASGSKKTPKPTSEDREIARRLNIDVNSYMKRKSKLDSTKKEETTGWVNVFQRN